MKLEELFAGKLFISDLGEFSADTHSGSSDVRYAVWAPVKGTERHQIIEVCDRLEPLMEKYHLSAESVCVLA